jgi:hypothetical protein
MTNDESAEARAAIVYAPARRRGGMVLASLGMLALLGAAMLACDLRYIAVCSALADHDATSEEWAALARLDRLMTWLSWATLGAHLGTIVAWCFWKHRAHSNLPALGAVNLQFTPRSAVYFYFLPIFQLFRPYQAMREIRHASAPRAGPVVDCRPQCVGVDPLVIVWWLTYLVACFARRAADSFGSKIAGSEDVSFFVMYAWGDVASIGLLLAATLFAAVVVASVDRRQDRRAALLGAASGRP